MNTRGYSRTPLIKKLGIKEGYQCLFLNTPAHYFELLGELPDVELVENATSENLDFIHLFSHSIEELENEFPSLKVALKKTGSLWISWPKKSSKIKSNLDGNVVITYGLNMGLVNVKVAAVDQDWSGLKFMYRVKGR